MMNVNQLLLGGLVSGLLKAKCGFLGKLNFLFPVVKWPGTQVLCVGSLVSDYAAGVFLIKWIEQYFKAFDMLEPFLCERI